MRVGLGATATIKKFDASGNFITKKTDHKTLSPYGSESFIQRSHSLAEGMSKNHDGFVELWLEFSDDPYVYDISIFHQGEKVCDLEIAGCGKPVHDYEGKQRRELYEKLLKGQMKDGLLNEQLEEREE